MAIFHSINGNEVEAHYAGGDLREEIESKADTNGYYATLTAGAADALMGDPSESTWARRTSTGSGMARVESVQGAAVVWNQLNRNNTFTSESNGVTFTKNDNGSWTFNGTATANVAKTFDSRASLVAQHKYLVRGCPSGGSANTYFMGFAGIKIDFGSGGIWTNPSSSSLNLRLDVRSGATFDNLTIWPQAFDLTAMFGAGNEPTTVAEFEAMFPEAYYPYSEPTLKPVQIAGIASTDAQGNALDGVEWETQTLRAAGSVRDELTAGELVTRVGVVVIDGVNVKAFNTIKASGRTHGLIDMGAGTMANNVSQLLISCDKLPAMSGLQEWIATLGICVGSDRFIRFVTPDIAEATSAADLNAWLQQNPLTCFYALATPTTTPINPALPMTYKVEQGGTESIVVPDGEVSAAPVITVADGESAADVVMDALACIATPDGPTATENHAINTYLTMGGKLWKVTRAIAVGEQIVSGTNVTETTVMAEVLSLIQ